MIAAGWPDPSVASLFRMPACFDSRLKSTFAAHRAGGVVGGIFETDSQTNRASAMTATHENAAPAISTTARTCRLQVAISGSGRPNG